MKKREKTANLVNESEILETQNIDLKSQIQDLQKQKRNLMDMLSMHLATCVKQTPTPTLENVQTFDEYVAGSESFNGSFQDGGQSSFCSDASGDFPIDHQTVTERINSKLINNMSTSYSRTSASSPSSSPSTSSSTSSSKSSSSTSSSSSSNNTSNDSNNTSTTAVYYQSKGKTNLGINKSNNFQTSENKSVKNKLITVQTTEMKKSSTGIYRTNFNCNYHHHHHNNNNDDSDIYKPNGLLDNNNFFTTTKTDVFGTGNDYSNAFGNNHLDNGCMA